MMLRIQKERMGQADLPDADHYFAMYGLTPERLRLARPDAIVMHPQPMNRGIEIASDVADGKQSVIRDQVRNGVAVRMAVLADVVGSSVANRGTIHLEDARVLQQSAYEGNQFVLRVQAPKCAARAEPGSFAHLTCDPSIPMRRPLSIMRVNASAGWIEMLYKVVGPGLQALSARKAGDTISVLGPIGKPFVAPPGAAAHAC